MIEITIHNSTKREKIKKTNLNNQSTTTNKQISPNNEE